LLWPLQSSSSTSSHVYLLMGITTLYAIVLYHQLICTPDSATAAAAVVNFCRRT
jgi:uncharacterized membrane protein YuzA (DUF378 family)